MLIGWILVDMGERQVISIISKSTSNRKDYHYRKKGCFIEEKV